MLFYLSNYCEVEKQEGSTWRPRQTVPTEFMAFFLLRFEDQVSIGEIHSLISIQMRTAGDHTQEAPGERTWKLNEWGKVCLDQREAERAGEGDV